MLATSAFNWHWCITWLLILVQRLSFAQNMCVMCAHFAVTHRINQSQGAINDWVNVQFNQGCVCPCKLVSVVIQDSDLDNPERYCLVVQPATSHSKQDSVLFQEWNWSPEYCDTSPNLIAGPCFVIDMGKDSSKILEIGRAHV